MRIVLVTYTGEDAPGGVPRWIRDFKRGFPEAVSFSWNDLKSSEQRAGSMLSEWDKAFALNTWLRQDGKISKDDIFIVDGFWGRGLEDFPNVVSVCHGIWSHLIKEEADAGKKPDFPLHHAIQVDYRRKHLERGGRLVAVSQFIKHQMEIQWGFESTVINNAIDLDEFVPTVRKSERSRPLIIHGVNDKGNKNKGWDHIEHVYDALHDEATIWSLDEAHHIFKQSLGYRSKYETLAQADLVIISSAYEGNSYFALETLACDVPVVAYDVGLFWEMSLFNPAYDEVGGYRPGFIMDRKRRSKEETLLTTKEFLKFKEFEFFDRLLVNPRMIASRYSIDKFHDKWREYLKGEFGYESPSAS